MPVARHDGRFTEELLHRFGKELLRLLRLEFTGHLRPQQQEENIFFSPLRLWVSVAAHAAIVH